MKNLRSKSKTVDITEEIKKAENCILKKDNKPSYLYVYTDKIKNRGIKSYRDFCAGEFITYYHGRFKLEAPANDDYTFELKKGKKPIFVDGSIEDGSYGRLINDNWLNPNLKVITVQTEQGPVPAFFAKCDIKAHTELEYNYGGVSSNYEWRRKSFHPLMSSVNKKMETEHKPLKHGSQLLKEHQPNAQGISKRLRSDESHNDSEGVLAAELNKLKGEVGVIHSKLDGLFEMVSSLMNIQCTPTSSSNKASPTLPSTEKEDPEKFVNEGKAAAFMGDVDIVDKGEAATIMTDVDLRTTSESEEPKCPSASPTLPSTEEDDPEKFANEGKAASVIADVGVRTTSSDSEVKISDKEYFPPSYVLQYPPPPAKSRITITEDDISCLHHNRYLNDIIIDFYIRWLYDNLDEKKRQRVCIFSSLFYQSLSQQRLQSQSQHDIFEKDYVFFPVCERNHWLLFVVVFPNLRGVLKVNSNRDPTLSLWQHSKSAEKVEDEGCTPSSGPTSDGTEISKEIIIRPCILIFDSLNAYTLDIEQNIRGYLAKTFYEKTGTERDFSKMSVISIRPEVPKQKNGTDCGVYLLHFVELFLQNPLTNFQTPMRSLKKWFRSKDIGSKREHINRLIQQLVLEQRVHIKPGLVEPKCPSASPTLPSTEEDDPEKFANEGKAASVIADVGVRTTSSDSEESKCPSAFSTLPSIEEEDPQNFANEGEAAAAMYEIVFADEGEAATVMADVDMHTTSSESEVAPIFCKQKYSETDSHNKKRPMCIVSDDDDSDMKSKKKRNDDSEVKTKKCNDSKINTQKKLNDHYIEIKPKKERNEDDFGIKPKKKSSEKTRRPCIFCNKFLADLSKHLLTVHKEEKIIKNLSKIESTFKKNKILEKLRVQGIVKENERRLKTGEELICIKKQKKNSRKAMCIQCGGIYLRRTMYLHKKRCCGRIINAPMKGFIPVEDLNLKKYTQDLHKDFENEILGHLRHDKIGNAIRRDPLLQVIANDEFEKIRGKKISRTTRKRVLKHVRSLCKLHNKFNLIRRKRNKPEVPLAKLFDVEYYQEIKKAMQEVCGSSSDLKSGAVKHYDSCIKKSVIALVSYFRENKTTEDKERTLEFYSHYCQNSQKIVSQSDLKNFSRRCILRRAEHMPSEDHITMLNEFLVNEFNDLLNDFTIYDKNNYIRLRRATVCHLVFFNARRPREVEDLTVEEWKLAKQNVYITEEQTEKLTDNELEILQNFRIAYNMSKISSKEVSILIPKACFKALDILADEENRKVADVSPTNIFMFPSTRHSTDPTSAYHDILNLCKRNKLSVHICADKMRHRLSTAIGNLDVPSQIKDFAYQHLGHSKEISETVYQMPKALKTILNVGPLLRGIDERNEKARTVWENIEENTDEDIENFISDDPTCIATPLKHMMNFASSSLDSEEVVDDASDDEECGSSVPVGGLNLQVNTPVNFCEPVINEVIKKKNDRIRWTYSDKIVIKKYFFKFLEGLEGTYPAPLEINTFFEEYPIILPSLKSLNEKKDKLRTYLNNTRTANKTRMEKALCQLKEIE